MNLLLKCNDINETRDFYSNKMQFFVSDSTEETISAEIANDSLIFSEADNLGTEPQMSGTMYFFLPDVEAYYSSIKGLIEVLWPLQQMSYGTYEFGIKDCNGYHLAFVQDQNT